MVRGKDSKSSPAPKPFEGYRIYGPYLSKKEQRRMVALVSDKHRTTMSYARYLLSVKLGRRLLESEEADHIDDDKTNDHINNLQILTQKENLEKAKPPEIICVCPMCDETFSLSSYLYKKRTRRNVTGLVACSSSCGGKMSH